MELVHVSPVRHRLAETEYADRPMPIATALRWIPVGQSGAVDPLNPIFIKQQALQAIQERALAPADSATFGFLVGEVYVAPETRLPYVVVESAVHGGWAVGKDQFPSALLEARKIAEEEVKDRAGGRVVGWYQTHAGPDSRPSLTDVEAHKACFDEPWHVALVVAGRRGLAGGVFRVSRGARWDQYLPFYELLEGDALLPGGRKVSGLVWENYCAPGLAVSVSDDMRPVRPPAARLLLLDEGLDDDELATEALRRRRMRRRASMPVLRVATLGGIGLVVVGALFGTYRAVASSLPAAVGPPPPGVSGSDPLADSVAFAVHGFSLRARLFAGGKMVCADLARGLIDVETRWTVYNRVRGGDGRLAGDHELQDDVAAVEQRFTNTGCSRP